MLHRLRFHDNIQHDEEELMELLAKLLTELKDEADNDNIGTLPNVDVFLSCGFLSS